MEETRDITVRCSISYEKLEGNDFCRYTFAVPMEDLYDGYTVGNNQAFEVTIDDEPKVVSVVALEGMRVQNTKIKDQKEDKAQEEDGSDEMLCQIFVFIGMEPMTPSEFKDFMKEMEEKVKQHEAEQAEQAKQEGGAMEDSVEDVDFLDVEENDGKPCLDFDLTQK